MIGRRDGSRRTPTRPSANAFAVIGFLVALDAVSLAQRARTLVWDGVYTKEQAERGEKAYKEACGYCHRDNLLGDEGPALTGSSFSARWSDQTVADMYTIVSATMPKDAPGTLDAAAYVDIIGFLLKSNGSPPGETALTSDLDQLRQIVITPKPPKSEDEQPRWRPALAR